MQILDTPPFSPVPARMAEWLRTLDARGDRSAAFLRSYAFSTCTALAAAEGGEFIDPDWTMSLLEVWAGYYFATLAPEHPLPTTRAPAWQAARRLATDPATTAQQLLLVALNAHVTGDLPQAIAALLGRDWPYGARRLPDRCADLEALLGIVGGAVEPLAPGHATRLVEGWRRDAWETALLLVTAGDGRWQAAICEDIEHAAHKRAHLIACLPLVPLNLITLPTSELHRAFDTLRGTRCRCGLTGSPADRWAGTTRGRAL